MSSHPSFTGNSAPRLRFSALVPTRATAKGLEYLLRRLVQSRLHLYGQRIARTRRVPQPIRATEGLPETSSSTRPAGRIRNRWQPSSWAPIVKRALGPPDAAGPAPLSKVTPLPPRVPRVPMGPIAGYKPLFPGSLPKTVWRFAMASEEFAHQSGACKQLRRN
jgi:hypothetical protein